MEQPGLVSTARLRRRGVTLLQRLAPGSTHRRPARPLGRILRDLPGDWLFERNAFVAKGVAAVMVAAAATLPVLGVASLGSVLAINMAISWTPACVQFLRLVGHSSAAVGRDYRRRTAGVHGLGITGRVRALGAAIDAGWDFTWWARPQMRQPGDVAVRPEPPLEMQLDPDDPGLSSGGRRILRLQKALLRATQAEATTPAQRGGRWLARQFDDWINMRARTPSFVIVAGMLAAGTFLGFPLTATMIVDNIVSWVPASLSIGIGWLSGDMYRASRPGIYQRPEVIRRWEQKRQTAGAGLMARAVAGLAHLRTRTNDGHGADGHAATTLRIALGHVRLLPARSRRSVPAAAPPAVGPVRPVVARGGATDGIGL